jgi:hypothetical protein
LSEKYPINGVRDDDLNGGYVNNNSKNNDSNDDNDNNDNDINNNNNNNNSNNIHTDIFHKKKNSNNNSKDFKNNQITLVNPIWVLDSITNYTVMPFI